MGYDTRNSSAPIHNNTSPKEKAPRVMGVSWYGGVTAVSQAAGFEVSYEAQVPVDDVETKIIALIDAPAFT